MSETATEPELEVTEPESPETGDVDETETVPEPPPVESDEPEADASAEPPVDQEAMEKVYKKIEQSATTYRNAVSRYLGEQAQDLSPCPLCSDGIMGMIFPPEWMQPTDALQARLLDVLKTPVEPDYQPAPNARRCGTCDGWGKVLSGSRVAGRERVQCPTCGGNGYQGQGAPVTNGNTDAAGVVLVEPEDEAPLVSGDKDIWGSPRLLEDGQENPNYGKMPQYKNPTLP